MIRYLTQLTRVRRRHGGVALHASYQQNNSITERRSQQNTGPFLGTGEEGTPEKMLLPHHILESGPLFSVSRYWKSGFILICSAFRKGSKEPGWDQRRQRAEKRRARARARERTRPVLSTGSWRMFIISAAAKAGVVIPSVVASLPLRSRRT